MEGMNWLNTKTSREKAEIIVPIVIAAIGGAWAFYAYLNDQGAHEVDYVVCRAEAENQCTMAHSEWVSCNTDAKMVMAQRCRDVQVTLEDKGGTCGIRIYKGKCTAK